MSPDPAPSNSAPPNPARGEAALMLGGRALVVRPSFESLVAAEQDVGPLFALVEKAAAGQLCLADTVALIYHCIVDRPDAMTRQALGELIAQAGIATLTPVLRTLLGQIIRGR